LINSAMLESISHPQPSVKLRKVLFQIQKYANSLYLAFAAKIKDHFRSLKSIGLRGPSCSSTVGDMLSNSPHSPGPLRHLNTARRSNILAVKLRRDYLTEYIDEVICSGVPIELRYIREAVQRLGFLCFIRNNI
jgi:hypothetical protein